MDRYLLAFLEDQSGVAGGTVTSVSFGGSAMTLLGKVDRGIATGIEIYAYGLVAPAMGAQTFTATRTGTAGFISLVGVALTGANQVIGPDAIQTQQAPALGSPKSDTITTIANNCAVFGMVQNDNGSIAFTTQVQIAASPTTAAKLARTSTFPFTPAGPVTFNWTQNAGGGWNDLLVSIAPSTTIAINSVSTWTISAAAGLTVSYSYTAYAAPVAPNDNSLATFGGI